MAHLLNFWRQYTIRILKMRGVPHGNVGWDLNDVDREWLRSNRHRNGREANQTPQKCSVVSTGKVTDRDQGVARLSRTNDVRLVLPKV